MDCDEDILLASDNEGDKEKMEVKEDVKEEEKEEKKEEVKEEKPVQKTEAKGKDDALTLAVKSYQNKATKPKPKNLTKSKFKFGYLKSLSISCVVLYPFKPELFHNETVLSYFKMAKTWLIKQTGFSEKSESGMVLQFKSLDEGDDAFDELKSELSRMEDVTVEHAQFMQLSDDDNFWGQQEIKFKDWVMNIGILKHQDIIEDFSSRILVLENVPQMTQAELRQEFPDAYNIIDFSYDEECTGFVAIEMKSCEECLSFLRKYRKKKDVKGANIDVNFASKRFDHFEHLIKNWLRSFPDIELDEMTDEERLEKVSLFVQMRDEKKIAEDGTAYLGMERLAKIHQINCDLHPITRHLFTDACIRVEKKKQVPEPETDQTFLVANMLHNGKEGRIKHERDRRRRMNIAKKRSGGDTKSTDEPQRKRRYEGSLVSRDRPFQARRRSGGAFGGGSGGGRLMGRNGAGFGGSMSGGMGMGGRMDGGGAMGDTVAALTNQVRRLTELAVIQGSGGGFNDGGAYNGGGGYGGGGYGGGGYGGGGYGGKFGGKRW